MTMKARRWLCVLLFLFMGCSDSWSEEERLDFIGACLDSPIGDNTPHLFCACWQDKIEEAGIGPNEFGDEENEGAERRAMMRCM